MQRLRRKLELSVAQCDVGVDLAVVVRLGKKKWDPKLISHWNDTIRMTKFVLCCFVWFVFNCLVGNLFLNFKFWIFHALFHVFMQYKWHTYGKVFDSNNHPYYHIRNIQHLCRISTNGPNNTASKSTTQFQELHSGRFSFFDGARHWKLWQGMCAI